MDQVEDTGGAKPLWRRIVDYPLVAMLIAIALVLLVSGLAAFIAERTPNVGGFTANMRFGVLGAIFLVLAYELLIRHLGERKRDDYRDPRALRHLLMGLGAGLGVFSIAVAIAAALGVYSISGQGDLTDLLPAFITAALFPAISEELVFRGIMFRWLEEWGGSWVALILSSVRFGLVHAFNPGSSWVAVSFIAIEAGVMLGAAYMLTRSLWLPMGIHAAWNFAQGEVYDIPVSGQAVHGLVDARLAGPPLLTGNGFGLEASILAVVIATAFGLWLLWLAVRRGEVIPPWWVRRRTVSSS